MALDRFQRAVYDLEKGMPPWLRRVWVPAILFIALLAVAYAALARFPFRG